MGQVPEPGYALFSISKHSVRRSLIAWGCFALAAFLLAALVTWLVVRVKHAPIDDDHTVRLEFLYPNSGLRPPGQTSDQSVPIDHARLAKLGTYSDVEYREDQGKTSLDVWFPPGLAGKVLISHLNGAAACQEVLAGPLDLSKASIAAQPIPQSDTKFHDDWIVTVDPTKPHDPLVYDSVIKAWTLGQNEYQIRFRCDLKPVADRETFVTKRVLVVARDAAGLGSYMGPDFTAIPYVYVQFPHVAGAEGVEFSGGYSWIGSSTVESPESQRGIKLGSQLEARWREADREGERDALLVIVGALIALGAAMMVEAVRPAVDRYIEPKLNPKAPPPAAS